MTRKCKAINIAVVTLEWSCSESVVRLVYFGTMIIASYICRKIGLVPRNCRTCIYQLQDWSSMVKLWFVLVVAIFLENCYYTILCESFVLIWRFYTLVATMLSWYTIINTITIKKCFTSLLNIRITFFYFTRVMFI